MSIPDSAEYWWDIKGYSKCYKNRSPKKIRFFLIVHPDNTKEDNARRRRLVTIMKMLAEKAEGKPVSRSRFKNIQWPELIEMLEKHNYIIKTELR